MVGCCETQTGLAGARALPVRRRAGVRDLVWAGEDTLKVRGTCIYREPVRRICLLNLAYQAFVDVDTPANGCHGYHEAERAVAEAQAQSECRPNALYQMWQDAIQGGQIKP